MKYRTCTALHGVVPSVLSEANDWRMGSPRAHHATVRDTKPPSDMTVIVEDSDTYEHGKRLEYTSSLREILGSGESPKMETSYDA